MLGFASQSMALFAVLWSLMCVLSGALVTDTMLKSVKPMSAYDSETGTISGEGEHGL